MLNIIGQLIVGLIIGALARLLISAKKLLPAARLVG